MSKKLTLYGFNNLTKSLSFNIYDVCYAETDQEQREYIEYIDEQYNAQRLTEILCRVTDIIGAHVLNISRQDYEPQGASVNLLVAEEPLLPGQVDESCNRGVLVDSCKLKRDTIHAHLDKSHITVHTYPEYHPENAISTFRVDIDVATCGRISPLNALNFLISSFDSDIITIDYKVRGFTRNMEGGKCFIDQEIQSIQNFIYPEILKEYVAVDLNLYQSSTFHTRMMVKEIVLQEYLFNQDADEIPLKKRREITEKLEKEMVEIFHGMNIY
ncbi:MAG: adenosylmethionine decarboxylase [Firmicutes bacterium]|nr:adenosylmethionine decarboxylase [Bacillota bacterium]NLL87405.1 adenosylmethionine decarboxylase [Bacillota bacterium]